MVERIKHPQKLGDRLSDPDEHEASFVVLADGWPEDVLRLHASLVEHLPGHDWELVLVDIPDATGAGDDTSERFATLDRTLHLPLKQRLGWAAGRNLGIRQASGALVAVVDTSVELTGDLLSPLSAHLADDGIGLVGRWGVVTADGFDYVEDDGPDVDGVEAYLMAGRRAVFAGAGMFHPRFRFYRNADLDLSFAVRAAGYRTIVDPALPVVRHVHRTWEATPEAERDEASRRNFFRFRDRWGERDDLYTRSRGTPR